MHTVLTQAIDGYDIIVGFDRTILDPEGTKKEVKKAEEKTDEKKAICSKLAEVKEYLLDRDAIMKGKKKVDKKGKKIDELTEKKNDGISIITSSYMKLITPNPHV